MKAIHPLAIILCTVAGYYSLDASILQSPCRRREIAIPRQIYAVLAAELTPYPSRTIMRAIKRDHATIYHARQTIQNLRATDSIFAACYLRLRNSVIQQLRKN